MVMVVGAIPAVDRNRLGYRVPCSGDWIAHSVGFMEDQQGGKET